MRDGVYFITKAGVTKPWLAFYGTYGKKDWRRATFASEEEANLMREEYEFEAEWLEEIDRKTEE